jgi:phage baseplate assembly protein gpV
LQDDRQAEALAQAELDAGVAREVTMEGVAEGDPRLRPGTRVEVRGVAATLTGSYVLTGVTHTCDAHKGFVSQIDTAPPPSRVWNTDATATLGVVTQLDDPERMGRVRVSLPAYGNVETDWLGVLATGGGAGKGLIALPDVGDQVLVLFTQQETAQGVVLGGLYGVNGPPDSGLEGGAVRRYTLQTPGGQRLQLDDGRKVIRIENSDGSYVELAPDRVRLHARRDLEIEALGRAVVIRGQSIDFEKV